MGPAERTRLESLKTDQQRIVHTTTSGVTERDKQNARDVAAHCSRRLERS